jgi:hypothetical protein
MKKWFKRFKPFKSFNPLLYPSPRPRGRMFNSLNGLNGALRQSLRTSSAAERIER